MNTSINDESIIEDLLNKFDFIKAEQILIYNNLRVYFNNGPLKEQVKSLLKCFLSNPKKSFDVIVPFIVYKDDMGGLNIAMVIMGNRIKFI